VSIGLLGHGPVVIDLRDNRSLTVVHSVGLWASTMRWCSVREVWIPLLSAIGGVALLIVLNVRDPTELSSVLQFGDTRLVFWNKWIVVGSMPSPAEARALEQHIENSLKTGDVVSALGSNDLYVACTFWGYARETLSRQARPLGVTSVDLRPYFAKVFTFSYVRVWVANVMATLMCGPLMFTLARVWRRLLRRRRTQCTVCGYPLRGLTSHRCPECGSELRAC
jgi:hypothetical protein